MREETARLEREMENVAIRYYCLDNSIRYYNRNLLDER